MGDKISTLFPDLVDVQYVYNVMDLGYRVGPYAIEKGLVEAKNGETSIIVRDKNTGMKIEQIVQTPDPIMSEEIQPARDYQTAADPYSGEGWRA